jgi:hypothetical protein
MSILKIKLPKSPRCIIAWEHKSKRPNRRSFDSLRYAPVAQDDSLLWTSDTAHQRMYPTVVNPSIKMGMPCQLSTASRSTATLSV